MTDTHTYTEVFPKHAFTGARERFVRRHRLRTESLAEWWASHDQVTHQNVLIKSVPCEVLTAGTQQRLQNEVATIQTIDSKTISSQVTLFEEDARLLVVTPLERGKTLRTILKNGPIGVSQTLAIARPILQALQLLHNNGILHRNVRPSSIFIERSDSGLYAKLTDLGINLCDHIEFSLRTTPSEELLYMSPCQAGTLDREPTAASDLYSLGLVLYECLSGAHPFPTTDASKLLRYHLSKPVPSLRALGLEVPAALDDLILRLVRKDPSDRYQSAQAVLDDLNELVEHTNLLQTNIVVGAHDVRRTITEPAFVARMHELTQLEEALRQTNNGQGDIFFLEAESGGGKTRLLEEFALRAIQHGARVLKGQGIDQGAQRPFQILLGLARSVASMAARNPTWASYLRGALGVQSDAVVNALPALAPILSSGDQTLLGPEALGEVRSLRALSSFINVLGSEHQPCVIILDDCQWADELTLSLLHHWQQNAQRNAHTPRHVLIVVAFRSEEVSTTHKLREVQPCKSVALAALPSHDIIALAESAAGTLPSAIVTTLTGLSGGNPFMVLAVLQGLVETGVLVANDSGWVVDESAHQTTQSSQHALTFLEHRMRCLPKDVLCLLRTAAILGKKFSATMAGTLTGVTSDQASSLMAEASRRQIVWLAPLSDTYAFVHDKLREALLTLLSEDERRQLHQRAGEYLEIHHPNLVFELAYHYDAANEVERALPYSLLAAKQARSQHALESAEHQYRIALRGVAASDEQTCLEIFIGLGDVLVLRGKYDEATLWYDRAASLASTDSILAQLENKRGEVAFKRSDYLAALGWCLRGLGRLNRRVPQRRTVFACLLVGEICRYALSATFPTLFRIGRRSLETAQAQADLLAIRLYERLVYLWFFAEGGKMQAAWAILHAVNLARRYQPTIELGRTYNVLANAIAAAFPPLIKWSPGWCDRASSIHRQLNNLHGEGQALAYRWTIDFATMRFDEGLANAKRAKTLLAVAGDQWDVNAAYWGTALGHYYKGQLRAAVEEAQQLYEGAKKLGDTQYVGNALWTWALASRGDLPIQPIEETLKAKALFTSTKVELLGALGLHLLANNNTEEAIRYLTQASRLNFRTMLVDTFTGSISAWLTTALRMHAERCTLLGQQRKYLLRQAARHAWIARWMGRIFRFPMAHALRESALIKSMQGHPKAARRLLDQALEAATRNAMPYEQALTLASRGALGAQLGWQEARQDMIEHAQILTRLGIESNKKHQPNTSLASVERFSALLEHGRRIATALSHQAIYSALREATQNLLRTESYNLYAPVCATEPNLFDPLSEQSACERAFIERTFTTGKTITLAAGQVDDSWRRAGVRSALCTPIHALGVVRACLYVTHHQVTELFGEREVRIAGFLGTIAGAALENADGFARISALSEERRKAQESLVALNSELEQRVALRTKDLAAANRELEAFCYSVSHDLRGPLRSIDGFSAILLKEYQTRLDERATDYLNRVCAATQRMSVLIDDLLDLSRITRSRLQRAPVNLADLARASIEQLRQFEPHRNISVDVPSTLTANADPRLLAIAIDNLIGNAWKFTSKTPVARITIGKQTYQQREIFFVQDNGAGFDMSGVNNLFLPFSRLHKASEFDGNGVGLATVHRIITRHAGKIWAEAQIGAGATFYFTLGEQT